MSKAILLSIQPKWCELIISGKKTIEVRKMRPKIYPPFKCYIYCTKEQLLTKSHNNGKIYISPETKYQGALERNGNITLSGYVIGEFVCDSIIRITYDKDGRELDGFAINGIIAKSCVPEKELYRYLQGKVPYLWHIYDLKIYDVPKPLSAFKPWNRECAYSDLGLAIPRCEECHECKIEKPPQSWCYVEEISNESWNICR